eukprot:scaffold4854_cov96-Skeletonema_dohrnii-CCMP3373.AAC.4
MPKIKYPAEDGRDEGGRKQQQQQGQENEGNATITRSPGASKSDVAATSAHAVNNDPRTLQTDRPCPYLHTMKASDLQLENVKVVLREFDCAPVVQNHTKAKGSKTGLKRGDVLILLNGKFLFDLQGGLLAVEDLLRKSHDDSDSNEIVFYSPPNRVGAQCSYIDPTTNHRCWNANTKRVSCGSVLCSTHTGPRADGQRFSESCPTPSGIRSELTCNAFIGNSGEPCPNPAVRDGKCPDHAARAKCNVIDSSTRKACTNTARSDGKCASHGGKDFCSAIIDISTGKTCTNKAVRDGKCGSHGGVDLCSAIIDISTGRTCTNIAVRAGKCGSHGGKDLCSAIFDISTGRTCTNKAVRDGKCGSHGGVDICSVIIDASTKRTCPNLAVLAGKCASHGGVDFCSAIIDISTGRICTNIAVRDGKCGSHGGKDFCSVIIDASTGRTCTNKAVHAGKCCSHGDKNRCTFLDCDGNRCIRDQVEGVGNMCRTCSNPTAERRISGCDDTVNSPSTIVIEHAKKGLKRWKSQMTEEQYKVAAKLHEMRTMLRHDNMQDTSTSVNGTITNLCIDMVDTHLTDKKYQGQSVFLDDATSEKWLPLKLYVHQRVMWSLKCSLRDNRVEHDYGEVLSVEKIRQILNAIDSALENFVKEHGVWPVAKLGSGNVDERHRDNNLYSSAIFDRKKCVVLTVDITNNERPEAERLGIGYLAGLGMCANVQLVRSAIPMTKNQARQRIGLYMMFSHSSSTPVHFAEDGLSRGGARCPPGMTMIPLSELPTPVSEQLNGNQTQDSGDEYNLEDSGAFSSELEDGNQGDCDGADDDSKTCVDGNGNEDDSPSIAVRTLRSSSKRKVTVASLKKDTSKKFKHDDNHAKMKYGDNIDDNDEKGGVVKLTNEIGVQACDSHFKTPDAKIFQPNTTPSGLSFDSSDYTAGELDGNAKNVMDEQRFGVKNSAFASVSSLENSCGKVVTPNPSPADDLFKSVNAGTSTESTAPHGVLPAGVHHPGMAQWQGGFPYQSMTGAMHPGAAVGGMAQWLGGYPVQPMAAGLVPPSHMEKHMGLVVAQTEWMREQALVSRKSRVTDDLARRITSALFAKHKSDLERFIQILKSGLIEVLAGSEVTNYEDPRTDLSELVKTLEQSVGDRRKKE